MQGLATSVQAQMSVDAAHAAVSLFDYRIPNLFPSIPRDFLPILSLFIYTRRCFPPGAGWDPLTTPLHISSALLEKHTAKGKSKKGREKKILLENLTTKEQEENDGLHHTSPTHKDKIHCIVFRRHRCHRIEMAKSV